MYFLEFNDLRLQKKKGRDNFALETSERRYKPSMYNLRRRVNNDYYTKG